jgi:hypothetical protein
MNRSVYFAACSFAMMALAAPVCWAGNLEPLRAHCTIGLSDDWGGKRDARRSETGKFSLRIEDEDCSGERHCGSSYSNSNEAFSRFTGISEADLSHEGAQLTATLAAEAGTFTCSGTVRDRELAGTAVFTPDAGFVKRMGEMGFAETDSKKLEAYAFVGVESGWARSLKETGIAGMDADKLIPLRIFNVTPAYIHSMTEMGYELPDADKLIAMRVQGVDPAEVREIRGMGYKPTLDELIQCRIFKITPEFIRQMEARNLKHLTIEKLVQIRIFKLDE